MPNWKALIYGKWYEPREQSCGSNLNICQAVLKSDNLLNKRGFVKTQLLRTVAKTSICQQGSLQNSFCHYKVTACFF